MVKKRRRGVRKEVVVSPQKRSPNKERTLAVKRRHERILITWGIVILSIIVLLFLLYALWPKQSPYVPFAKCLTKEGAIMYGTDWCSHCQAQKRLFGKAFKEVAFVNCDYSTSCEVAGINGYPSWIFADGTLIEGEVALEQLAEKTGCSLP